MAMRDGITLYVQDDDVFVDLGNGYLMSIGTKKEVDAATPDRIVELICQALGWRQFHNINTAQGMRLH